jgi:hypothetical protein
MLTASIAHAFDPMDDVVAAAGNLACFGCEDASDDDAVVTPATTVLDRSTQRCQDGPDRVTAQPVEWRCAIQASALGHARRAESASSSTSRPLPLRL